MYNGDRTVIYVGKAKNLSNRLHSYFVSNLPSAKTRALVSNIASIEYTVTPSEADALILEQNLIKEHKPRYNILLRDDKSYPYILVTADEYPRILSHRGPKKIRGSYYGPYPDATSVKESLKFLQSIFPVRQCGNNTFFGRSRPCLYWQMKKCLGPCVKGLVSDEEYRRNVAMTELFLKGRHDEILQDLTAEMIKAGEECRFEEAAVIRDRIFALRRVQQQQVIDGDGAGDVDIVSSACRSALACINVIFMRDGRLLGSSNYFLPCADKSQLPEILRIFFEQYYLSKPAFGVPQEVALDASASAGDLRPDEDFAKTLSSALGQTLSFVSPQRGRLARLVEMGRDNVKAALDARLQSSKLQQERMEDLEKLFALAPGSVGRMECYDISHTFGERTVASQVVFGRQGPENGKYRLYNIAGITPGDDFAAMRQALERRFLKADSDDGFPDILFIDGGDGQLAQAEEIVSETREKFPGYNPLIVGVSKGEGRKPGLETLHMGYTREELNPAPDAPAFLLIQHIRDESHRFAITNHRRQRSAHKIVSRLEQIPGVGKKKRQDLLNRFGGLKEIASASRDEIAKVEGIGDKLAGVIYDWLHHTDSS